MDGHSARTGHSNLAAFERDGCPSGRGQLDGLLARELAFGIGAGDLEAVLALYLHLIGLGLQVQIALAGDEFQTLARALHTGQHADRLAAIDMQAFADGPVAVGAAGDGERFVGMPVHVLAGDDTETRLGGDRQDRIGGVGAFGIRQRRILVVRIGRGLLPVGGIDLPLGRFEQRGQRAGFGIDR